VLQLSRFGNVGKEGLLPSYDTETQHLIGHIFLDVVGGGDEICSSILSWYRRISLVFSTFKPCHKSVNALFTDSKTQSPLVTSSR
jgi:hypothetical protein